MIHAEHFSLSLGSHKPVLLSHEWGREGGGMSNCKMCSHPAQAQADTAVEWKSLVLGKGAVPSATLCLVAVGFNVNSRNGQECGRVAPKI